MLFLTPEHKNIASEPPPDGLISLENSVFWGGKRASITNLNWFEWSLFTLVVFLRCQALRKSSYDLICSESTHATTIFLQFFVKKKCKNRLSASTMRGSITNIISYWYRLKENFIGFPTKKPACKSNKNSLQAWPIHQGMYICIFPIFAIFTMDV